VMQSRVYVSVFCPPPASAFLLTTAPPRHLPDTRTLPVPATDTTL
jgi:hypothetical protein